LIAAALIAIGVYAIEFYAESRFPEEEFHFTGLPVFSSKENNYTFFRAGEEVGFYNYTVEQSGMNYLMKCTTKVGIEEGNIHLESSYTFDTDFLPIDYVLNVTESGEKTFIKCKFESKVIITSVTFQGDTVEVEEEIEEELYLIENSMPSFWEILITSGNLEPGKRYYLNIFIPQSARVIPITLVVEKNTKDIDLDGITYECIVVRESQLELNFYIHEGELILYEDFRQDTALRKIL
jgi:hypothetical protein